MTKEEMKALVGSLGDIARALDQLGFGKMFSARGGPGAFEGHTMMMRDEIVPQLCTAIENGFERLAEAIESRGAK